MGDRGRDGTCMWGRVVRRLGNLGILGKFQGLVADIGQARVKARVKNASGACILVGCSPAYTPSCRGTPQIIGEEGVCIGKRPGYRKARPS